MLHLIRPNRIALLSSVLMAAWFTAGCTKKEPAADSQPAAPAVEELNLVYALPEGGAEELLDFINDMAAREPAGETDEARTQDIGNFMTSRIAAAEKLVNLPDGQEQYGGLAARTKMESLRVLVMIGQEGAAQRFADYADELAESDEPELVSVGAIAKFQQQVDEFLMTGEAQDGSGIASAYQQLVDEQGDTEAVFFAGEEAATMLRQAGKLDASLAMIDVVSQSFVDHSEERIAEAALSLANDAKALQFQKEFAAFRMGGGTNPTGVIGAAKEILSGDVDPQLMALVMQAAQALEYSGKVDAAGELYENVRAVVQDGDTDARVTAALEDAERRLGLLGEPFEVVGTIVGGDELDWADYTDKVVLVDFWATWCGPCIREVPNIRRNYDQYKEKGFEVIGVNLDDSVATVEEYLESHELPWATVVGSDEDQLGFDNPNAVKCGVKAIPFLVLIDKTGQVAALHTRGPLLDEKLIELLGEPAEEEMLEIVDPSETDDQPQEEMTAEAEITEPETDADEETL